MSWIFGKKKSKESPVDVDRTVCQTPPIAQDGTPYPSSLYPFIGGTPTYPSPSSDLTKQSQQPDVQHYLSRVPFKLSKQLESNMNNDFEIDRLRVNEILSFVQRIEEQNFDYDFSLEKSVITEMNSTNDE